MENVLLSMHGAIETLDTRKERASMQRAVLLRRSREEVVGETPFIDWLEIPTDVLYEIFVCLGGTFLSESASLVCKHWNRICTKDELLWERLYRSLSPSPERYMSCPEGWRRAFIMQHRWRHWALSERQIAASRDIRCLAFEGASLAVCSGNRVRLWDIEAASCLCELDVQSANSTCLAICGDSVALGSRDGILRRCRISGTHSAVCSVALTQGPIVCFAMDLQTIVAGSVDGQVYVVNADTLESVAVLCGHRQQVWCVGLNEDFIFSGSGDSCVILWSRETMECAATLRGHSGPVYALATQGNVLATGSYDRTLRLWDLSSLSCVQTLQGHSRAVRAVALDGNRVVSASWDREIRIWDSLSSETIRVVAPRTRPLYFVALKDSRLVSCGYDNVVRLWKLEGYRKDSSCNWIAHL